MADSLIIWKEGDSPDRAQEFLDRYPPVLFDETKANSHHRGGWCGNFLDWWCSRQPGHAGPHLAATGKTRDDRSYAWQDVRQVWFDNELAMAVFKAREAAKE